MAEPGFGVYVHIPFCLHRCHYCDFNTYEGQDELHRPYVDALVRHIETAPQLARSGRATSVFFGGGTPTLLETGDLARILAAVGNGCGIAPGAEVTIEANPETVDEATFEALLTAGFNRVSIGVQSLVPHVLKGLGRTHSGERALEAIGAARRAGMADVSADLIYGSVWEKDDDWRVSLEGVVDAAPDHISAYALTVEDTTPLGTLVRTGRLPDVDPDVQAARHEVADVILGAAGYERYEVSNWAQPGRASRHNVLYWSGGDYAGLGAGAHGHVAGRRYWSVRLPRDFIDRAGGLGRTQGQKAESNGSVEDGYEVLTADERAPEALMLGLRLTSGVEVAAFNDRFGAAYLDSRAALIADLIAQGLLENVGGWLRLSPRAVMVANDVIARLI
jgi:oxygen-independent coproporphyrinogen-3 oxidase